MKLGFNIDHIATLRNARNEGYPNIIEAANEAISAGASQITAHLREDRRHIKDDDIVNLKNKVNAPLNMEMAATEEMVNIALNVKPYSVCLVPEKREEITTEGGLNVAENYKELEPKISLLNNAGIKTVLFIDARKEQIEASIGLNVFGVEFNTGIYANSSLNNKLVELQNIRKMAKLAVLNNLEAHAGHGLNYNNITEIAEIKEINEFNIGHFLIANAVFVGLSSSIKKMIELINKAKGII